MVCSARNEYDLRRRGAPRVSKGYKGREEPRDRLVRTPSRRRKDVERGDRGCRRSRHPGERHQVLRVPPG